MILSAFNETNASDNKVVSQIQGDNNAVVL